MLTEYIQAALRKARYDILPSEGGYFGEIPGFRGVYATTPTLESCRKELREVLEEWILLRVAKNLPLPEVDGVRLRVKRVA
jgi:predicted RNase H-like HicB family nuclease